MVLGVDGWRLGGLGYGLRCRSSRFRNLGFRAYGLGVQACGFGLGLPCAYLTANHLGSRKPAATGNCTFLGATHQALTLKL